MAPKRSGSASAARWAAVGVVSVVVVAVSGLTGTAPAVALNKVGHYAYNHTIGAIADIDGGSKSVAQTIPAPGLSADTRVTSAGQDITAIDPRTGRSITYGRSDARVKLTQNVPRETPLIVETALASYVVYPTAERVSRLGDHLLSLSTDGALATPIGTNDGTLWALRPSTGEVCHLTARGRALICHEAIPDGHTGQLVALDDRPVLVDRTASTFVTLTADGAKARTVKMAEPLPADARLASADAGGRLPMIVPRGTGSGLVLLDTSAVHAGSAPAAPAPVALPAGDYDSPLIAGGSVVLVNQSAHTVSTYDLEGKRRDTANLRADKGPLRASHGQDGRVYIDNREGTRTTVVDGDGTMTPVSSSGRDAPKGGKPTGTPQDDPSAPSTPSGSPSGPPSGSPSKPSTKPGGPGTGGTTSGSSSDPPPRRSSGSNRNEPPERPRTAPPARSSTKPPPASTGKPGRTPRTGSGSGTGTGTQKPKRPQKPSTPKAEAPDAPARVDATATTTSVDATWPRPAANGAPLTGYKVTLRSGGKQVDSKTVAAGTLRATFTGLTAGTKYVVTVAARNRVGLGKSTSSDSVTPKAPTPTCAEAMRAAGPTLLYRLNDAGGTATDSSGNGRNGNYVGGVGHGAAGPCGSANGINTDGRSGYATTQAVFSNPTTFTTAVWFKTTSGQGGLIIGFGSNLTGNDSHFDRQVYMLNSGQLSFGVFNNKVYLTTPSTARSYNDGQWHLVAASLGANGMNLYVDGQLVGHDDNTTNAPGYDGHWNIGWGNMDLWPNRPTSDYFGGTLALAAVYDHVLTPAQIAAMYQARG